MFGTNKIFCSFSAYEDIKACGYTKELIPDKHCPNHQWYYISKAGKFRTVIPGDGIYTSVLDDIGYPTGFIKRIRVIKSI